MKIMELKFLDYHLNFFLIDKTNPKVPNYTYDFALEHLKRIGKYAKEKI